MKKLISIVMILGLFSCEEESPCNHPEMLKAREAMLRCSRGETEGCMEYIRLFDSKHVTHENLMRCGYLRAFPFNDAVMGEN